ncbi:MAG TPA: PQQ-dependent sugar dehydrogenase [Rhodanobacteraceae bacterium]|nr:PQQ-dependent sugar dehydrogenase [Rhodanobacteraceae bacterium]
MHFRASLLAATLLVAAAGVAPAQNLPAGFFRTDPITGRELPTGVYFAHDGRVFVVGKTGHVYVYHNLLDTAPILSADISAEIHTVGDRGLLGFALDPRFPEVPHVYMLYSFNGGLFSDPPPRWGSDCGTTTDPSPPENSPGGCVIGAHLSRFDVDGDMIDLSSETVLIEDWYQFFPSHSIGTLLFGSDGYLYVGGGEGASYNWADWGQGVGNPTYPDERSPMISGVPEGGALRAQGLEVESDYTNQQVWLDGTILRVNPATGEGAPDNPLTSTGLSENAKRIIAYGMRNPFRFTERPGTGEIWVGDVGWNTWEEVNRIPALPNDGSATLVNFGWPCFEGRQRTVDYSSADLPICVSLYENNNTGGRTAWTPPWYTYVHTASSDITGLVFYKGTSYPAAYQNSLFTADNSRSILFNIPYVDNDGDGIPDPPADSTATAFYGGVNATGVQLVSGPGDDVFYPNINLGRISRISYCNGCTNVAPSAAIALAAGSLADGPPRTITFDATNSVDPDGDSLTYDWDLDGDGTFGDASGDTATYAYANGGIYRVSVRVTDTSGASDVQSMIITVTQPIADVGVTIDDGVTEVAPGAGVVYTMTLTNHGTDLVQAEHAATALAPALTNVRWTCVATSGGACTASGNGNIAEDVDLAPGGTVTFTISAQVALNASGTLDSSATVTPPPGYEDPNTTDNTATDTDIVTISDRIFANGFDPP